MKYQNHSAALCYEPDQARIAGRMGGSAFLAAAAFGFLAMAPVLTAHAQSAQNPTSQAATSQAPTSQAPSSQAPSVQTSSDQASTSQAGAAQPGATQVSGRDTLYDGRTAPKGASPGMDWHVVVHPDKTLNGVVSWDSSKHMAHLTGTLDDNGAFKANAVESGTNKSDPVSGTVRGSDMRASISGTGTPCDNETMNLPKVTNGNSRG